MHLSERNRDNNYKVLSNAEAPQVHFTLCWYYLGHQCTNISLDMKLCIIFTINVYKNVRKLWWVPITVQQTPKIDGVKPKDLQLFIINLFSAFLYQDGLLGQTLRDSTARARAPPSLGQTPREPCTAPLSPPTVFILGFFLLFYILRRLCQ